MTTDETRLDNELAAFTDHLLTGEDAQVTPEIEPLAQVVRQFHQLVDPDSGPAPAFRERLAQRLDQEWALIQEENQTAASGRQHAPPAPDTPTRDSWQDKLEMRRSSRSTIARLGRSRVARLAAVAATILVALSVAYLIDYSSDGPSGQSGTASGDIAWSVIVGVVVVGLLGLLAFWLGQRSKL